MPSITLRFDWDGQPSAEAQARALREMAGYLQTTICAAYTEDGEDLMGYDGAMVDDLTLDAIVDDGHGITHADRERAALDDEHEARARARAEEFHTEEP